VVVAVAGGIVAEADTFERLLDRFHTVWVKTSPEEHMARVRAQGDTRPMEGNPQAMVQLRLILKGREADYARADAVLDTSGARVEDSAAELLDLIRQTGFITETAP
jgi:XRE family aerobic/anaerobic benzoate catabolism transcriptional regulator